MAIAQEIKVILLDEIYFSIYGYGVNVIRVYKKEGAPFIYKFPKGNMDNYIR
jgi:hypothetical protein